MEKIIRNKNRGYVVITTVIFFLIISLAVISAVVIPTSNQIKSVRTELKTKQGYLAADNVNEEALYRLNQGKTLPSSLTLPFSTGPLATASVTTTGTTVHVLTTGTDSDTTRLADSVFSAGNVMGFNYAAQIGTGGLSLTGGSYVTGSAYSNGPVTEDSAVNYVTGSLTVANTAPAAVDQTNSYTNSTTPVSVDVDKATATQDVAQSFKVTSSLPVTSLRLYLKKTGAPTSNATIRIVPDLSGKPSNTGTLGTGTLSASNVTTSFTYVTVPIASAPTLTLGTTYWIVIDHTFTSTAFNAANYYTFAATNSTYANGIAKQGSWNSVASKNTWVAVTPANSDLYFDLFVGGLPNAISGSSQWNRLQVGTSGTGIAWANQINSVTAPGSIYCQTGTFLYDPNGSTKTCNTTRSDPAPLDFPITDDNINAWKAIAVTGGTLTSTSIGGGITATMGPKKINGNLLVSGGSTLNLSGVVWVTGYIQITGGSKIKLASTYGASDGLIIADGVIDAEGGSTFEGSGTVGSFMVSMTTSQCPTTGICTGGINAYNVSGGSGSVVGFAPYGTMSLTGGAVINSAVAKRILVDGGSSINYNTALSSIDFITQGTPPSGQSSQWNVDSWAEVSQ